MDPRVDPIPPRLEPPVAIRLTTLPPVPCPYLPGRSETLRAIMASSIDGETYRAFMDAGFRRSGRMLYQPICPECNECRPLRVLANEFAPTKSQRRCLRRNHDLRIQFETPTLTDEKYDLYARYVHDWHSRAEEADRESLKSFLYDSPTETIEFAYRDSNHVLLAVGICDVSSTSLSSVYFYFDPRESKRGLGTFGALTELEFCRTHRLPHYYLGYHVHDCPAMSYKAAYRPHELLDHSGKWRRA